MGALRRARGKPSCVGRLKLRNNITVIFQDARQNHVETDYLLVLLYNRRINL